MSDFKCESCGHNLFARISEPPDPTYKCQKCGHTFKDRAPLEITEEGHIRYGNLGAIALANAKHERPIDGILFCPNCGLQHVDKAAEGWSNPPHRSHLCAGCSYIWRPFDVPTNGVAEIKTEGHNDARPHRGRAPAVLHEQHRCVEIVQKIAAQGSPRLSELLRNVVKSMRHRP